MPSLYELEIGARYNDIRFRSIGPNIFRKARGSFVIPSESTVKANLCLVTKRALDMAIRAAQAGWTLATAKRYLTAQYEHTMVITKGRPLIMTLPH